MKTNLKKIQQQALDCVMCGSCRSVCPMVRATSDERLGPRAKAAALSQQQEFDKASLKSLETCLLCGACREKCPHAIDTPLMLLKHRQRTKTSTAGQALFKILRRHPLLEKLVGQVQTLDKKSSTAKIKDTFSTDRADALVFLGCQSNIYTDVVGAARSTLGSIGMRSNAPSDQICCGLPLLALGEWDLAKKAVLKNLELFESRGQPIYSCCSSCTYAMRSVWPLLFNEDDPQLKNRVENLSRRVEDLFLALLKEKQPSSIPLKQKITLHLPCHLRHGLTDADTVYDFMQQVAGEKFSAPEDLEKCCGFGGTFSIKQPQLAKDILAKRVKELAATGAELVLTPCPGCSHYLQYGFKAAGLEVAVEHPLSWLVQNKHNAKKE